MGMMAVVSTEAEHPWDDLSVPIAKTVRRPSVVRVVYLKSHGQWRATSPDLASIKMARGSLMQLQTDLRVRLRAWLAPDIRVVEQVVKAHRKVVPPRPSVELIGPRPVPIELSTSRHSRTRALNSSVDQVSA